MAQYTEKISLIIRVVLYFNGIFLYYLFLMIQYYWQLIFSFLQVHYPFENKREFEDTFPADFIAEGIDQTRGWFYTLLVISTALFGKPPFKNLIVNGLVLAEDGQKMSKRKKNYPDPMDMVEKYGADALRLYLINRRVYAELFII